MKKQKQTLVMCEGGKYDFEEGIEMRG